MRQSKHSTQFLVQLIREKSWYYVGSVFAVSIASFFMFLGPTIGRLVIDTHFSSEEAIPNKWLQWLASWFDSPDRLWLAGVAIVAMAAISGIFMYLKDLLAARACESTVRDLREALFAHLHRLPQDQLDIADSGDLVQRCTSDIDTLRQFLTRQIMDMGRSVILMCIIIPLILLQSPIMTAMSLCLMPVVFIFNWYFYGRIKYLFQRVDEAEGNLTTIVQENLTGIRVVRAFARQAFECEKFDRTNQAYREVHTKLMHTLANSWAFTDFLCITQKGIVLIAGASFAASGDISVGTYFAFIGYAILLIYPIRQLGQQVSEAGKASVAIGRIREVLTMPQEQPLNVERALPENFKPSIEFSKVSFAYRPGEYALQEISFHIQPGETIAIVGPTGAGKTTLVHLLMRLRDYQKGSIKLGGYELQNLTRTSVRKQIGSLLQEPFLFSRSLRENIKFARLGATDQQMFQSCREAAVHETIRGFVDEYDTRIGERGVSLSGGQKQRVTLSRTLLKNTPILVLDDTLSAVDTATEQTIIDALQQKGGRQTLLIITHRISVCRYADRVFVIQNGRLAAQGSHAEVENTNSFYARLWRIQSHQQTDFESTLASFQ